MKRIVAGQQLPSEIDALVADIRSISERVAELEDSFYDTDYWSVLIDAHDHLTRCLGVFARYKLGRRQV